MCCVIVDGILNLNLENNVPWTTFFIFIGSFIKKKTGEKCMMRNFIICNLLCILLG